ncbi:OLC1v1013392C1 [Oldenlandia corymbosa var. corymbosa]|uniref:Non-specific lipid-transfer protein n=1 Tax=Oldenlandia corymbosa var. corymbosa TaxID=529605 RepID=A0AAV1E1M1_OLDCO|nr:OLC1v1013392C1 [Oldenlandia corymbosa var. corymbosa]
MGSKSTLLIKLFCVILLGLLILAPHAEAVIGCGTVNNILMPCTLYIRGGPLTRICCSNIKALKASAATKADRQAVCRCLERIAKAKVLARAPRILRQCGVSIPYALNPNINCATIVLEVNFIGTTIELRINKGGLLVLRRYYDDEDLALDSIRIDKFSVWVRTHGVPISLLNYARARDLAKRVRHIALVKEDCVSLRKATYVRAKSQFTAKGILSMFDNSSGASVVPFVFIPIVNDFPPSDNSSPENVFCPFIFAEFSYSESSSLSSPPIHNISTSPARNDDIVICQLERDMAYYASSDEGDFAAHSVKKGFAGASLKCRSKRIQKPKAHRHGMAKKKSSNAIDVGTDTQSSCNSFCMKVKKAQLEAEIPARPKFLVLNKAQSRTKAHSQGGWRMKVESDDEDESESVTVEQIDSQKRHSDDSEAELPTKMKKRSCDAALPVFSFSLQA